MDREHEEKKNKIYEVTAEILSIAYQRWEHRTSDFDQVHQQIGGDRGRHRAHLREGAGRSRGQAGLALHMYYPHAGPSRSSIDGDVETIDPTS